MEFQLFSKLASLEGIELFMLLGGLVVLGVLIAVVVSYAKRAKAQAAIQPGRLTLALPAYLYCFTLSRISLAFGTVL